MSCLLKTTVENIFCGLAAWLRAACLAPSCLPGSELPELSLNTEETVFLCSLPSSFVYFFLVWHMSMWLCAALQPVSSLLCNCSIYVQVFWDTHSTCTQWSPSPTLCISQHLYSTWPPWTWKSMPPSLDFTRIQKLPSTFSCWLKQVSISEALKVHLINWALMQN